MAGSNVRNGPATEMGRGGRARRSVPMLAAGLLLVAGCALVSVQVAARAGEREPVLIAARDLPAGRMIRTEDVRIARVVVPSGVRLVPAAERGHVVGQPARVAVSAGEPLPIVLADGGRSAAPGLSVVGVVAKPGQAPPNLVPGAQVRLVLSGDTPEPQVTVTGGDTGQPTDQATDGPVRGTVLSVRPTGTGDGAMVAAVQVGAADAASVARAAADGSVSIVQDGQG